MWGQETQPPKQAGQLGTKRLWELESEPRTRAKVRWCRATKACFVIVWRVMARSRGTTDDRSSQMPRETYEKERITIITITYRSIVIAWNWVTYGSCFTSERIWAILSVNGGARTNHSVWISSLGRSCIKERMIMCVQVGPTPSRNGTHSLLRRRSPWCLAVRVEELDNKSTVDVKFVKPPLKRRHR